MNPLQVIRNEFLHLLGDDHVAVDASGTPVARAGSLDAVKQAAPDAAAYFTGKDFEAPEPAPEPAPAPAKPVQVPGTLGAAAATPTTATAAKTETTIKPSEPALAK